MTNTLFITLRNDAAGIERVLQCARFRRFAVHSFSGESINNLTAVTLTVSGNAAIEQLMAQMRKLHSVQDIELEQREGRVVNG